MILLILALIAAYLILSAAPPDGSPDDLNRSRTPPINNSRFDAPEFGNETPVDAEAFLSALESAQDIAIIQDLRAANDDIVKRNILQCGADFAGSSEFGYLIELMKRNVTTYALEEQECTTINGVFGLASCLDRIKNADVTIHIRSGTQYAFYADKLIVGVDRGYSTGQCGIQRQMPVPLIENQTGNQTDSQTG